MWERSGLGVYIIAEAGVNHNGDAIMARELVDAAQEAGADAVKFQAFTAEELATPEAPKAKYQKQSGTVGESQFEMLKRLELSEEMLGNVIGYCREKGIEFLATPFSPRWVSFLRDLGVKAIKIGSGNLTSGPLLKAIGLTRLPVILSTGMATLEEIDEVLRTLRAYGSDQPAVLHCVSLYPAPAEKVNLRMIRTLAEHTGLPAGFSDHTTGTMMGALAVAAGAVILEKHFTLDKRLEGPDHAMSLEPDELREYVERARESVRICGDGIKSITKEEQAVRLAAGMSVVVGAKPLRQGTVITPAMLEDEILTVKRPGGGIPGNDIERLVGKTIARDLSRYHILNWDDVKNGSEEMKA